MSELQPPRIIWDTNPEGVPRLSASWQEPIRELELAMGEFSEQEVLNILLDPKRTQNDSRRQC